MPHFFISYAKKDTRELALALSDALNAIPSVTAWVDRSLKAGKSWELQIQSEIDKCDYFVVLYSPDINRHKQGQEESYVLTEIHYAKYELKKPIIPVMAEKTSPPLSLITMHYIDYTHNDLNINYLSEAICAEAGIELNRALPANEYTPTALELAIDKARNFRGTRNSDWKPVIMKLGEIVPSSPIPDLEMCLVPVGKFMMGDNDDEYYPQLIHEQSILQPYWIGRYPVSNAQWRLGVEAGAVREPNYTRGYNDENMGDYPVYCIDWFQSLQFAQWAKASLPTEPLWEYAARGIENWVYPWGNDWEDGKRVVANQTQVDTISSKPEGASWVGALHLSGNILQWQLNWYMDYPYLAGDGREVELDNEELARTLRGSSYHYKNPFVFRSTFRQSYDQYSWDADIGFRICSVLI